MCIYSAIGPMFEPVIPLPVTPSVPAPATHIPGAQWPWGPVPASGMAISPEDLRALIDAFHKAVAAAKQADKASGQPDCSDPEKVKLEQRVAELERRLDAYEATAKCCPPGDGAWFGPCADGRNHRPWCDVSVAAGSGYAKPEAAK